MIAPPVPNPIAARLHRALAMLGLIALLVALLIVGPGGPPAHAQSIAARGAEHDDFGRLVLDFTQPVASQIVADGAHMEVRLGRAASIDLAGALGNLKTYLKSARLSPDRRRLDLDFTGPVTWNAFNDGTKLAVDFALADESGQQQLEKGPDPASVRLAPEGAAAQTVAAAKPAPLPRVSLRAGEHDGYSRLAFDWPKDVPYEVRQSGDRLDLIFASPAAVDLDGAVGDLPSRLNAIGADPHPDSVTVHMQTKPDVVVRDFRSGHTVVLDIYDRNAANIPPKVTPEADTEMPPVASAAPEPAEGPRPVEGLLPVPPDMPMAEMTPLEAEPAPSQSVPSQPIGAAPEPAAPEQKLATDLQSAMPQPAEAPPAPVAGVGVSGPGVAVPVAAAPASTFEPPRVPPPAVQVNVTALSAKDSATLYFDWPKPVALAVFRRGDALWLAFDVPGKADLRQLKRLEPVIGKVEPVASPFSLALRLTGGKAGSVTTATEGARWKVTLLPGNTMKPTQPLEQKRETLPTGATSLFVRAIASGALVELKDPENGARLAVTPEQIPGLGIARESDWPDFKLLPSHQGVVVEVLNDGTKVQAGPNGVVITTTPASAAVAAAAPQVEQPAPAPSASAPSPDAAAPAEAAPESPTPAQPAAPVAGLFDLDKWRGSGPDNFEADLAELKAHTDIGSAADRNQAKIRLAEFYLANGYNPEATTWVELVRHDDRNADNNPLVMALGAAAYAMAGDFDRATRMLGAPVLKDVPEANLMRAVIAQSQGRSADAAKLFSGPLPDLKPYPKPFRDRARVLAAKALLEYGDPLTAQNFLDPLKSDAPTADSAAWADYLEGLRLSKLGQKPAARLVWEKLQDSPVDEIKARSRFALISDQLEQKTIDPADAAKQLEALRYLWRGDTFEFDLLYKLGKLYFDAGQPRRSLLTLRQAATHFPDHPLAKQAAADMAGEFHDLYLGGAADTLSPLTAVALYDEFRELTPPGAEGDKMIAALADRLVKVDLLDRAGDLLERQVKTRLSGVDKVAAGTRAAAIRLLDDKPDLALAALKASEDPAGSPDLVAERKRLQARALFDTGETLQGIALVRDDTSREGLWLKSDMFWKLKEWPSAAEALGQLIEAEQAKRAAATAAATVPTADITKNPASVLDNALAQAQAAAAADAANAPPDPSAAPAATPPPAANGAPPAAPAANAQPPAATPPAGPQFDPVLASLVMNRAVALSLANDRRGLREIGRSFGKDMAQSALAQPFQVLTSPDTGLAESITAQMKSVDQLGSFVDEYKKILKTESLSGVAEPNPDTGPTVPMESPNSGAAPSPGATPQTAEQSQAQQPTVQ